MPTCTDPKCGKRLMPVRRPEGTWSERHPTPQCDPGGGPWLTPEELAELDARYPDPAQEAVPT